MRLLTALALAALVALPAAAQVHVESEDGRVVVRVEDGTVVIEEGDPEAPRVRRFSLRDGGPWPDDQGPRRRALRFHTDSLGFDFDFHGLEHLPDLAGLAELEALEHLRGFEFDLDLPGVFALGAAGPFGEFRGASPETRRELLDGERALRDLAREARRADGAERQRLERQLDQQLEEQFARRQEARREALEARRERLERQREQLEALRRELREQEDELKARDAKRRDVIRERRQELLGSDGEGW